MHATTAATEGRDRKTKKVTWHGGFSYEEEV
jgi:hypothetical protein